MKHARAICLASAAFALGQAVQVNNGVIAPAAIAWLSFAIVVLVLALRERPPAILDRVPVGALLIVFAAVQWTELLVWGVRWLSRSHGSIGWYVGGMLIAACGVVIASRWAQRPMIAVLILVLGHLIAGGYVIRAIPAPRIDVWEFQQRSSEALLAGENPYTVRFRNLYDPDTSFYGDGMVTNGWLNCSCPYPPLSLILGAPARAIGGDVRWSHLLSLELAAILITLAAGRGGFWAAAMILLMPRSLLVIAVAWTDAHVILMLAAVFYCAVRAPRGLWLALGLLLASKQYTALMLPLAFLLTQTRRDALRLMAGAIAVAGAITLPFFLWDPTAFWRNIVVLQFKLPFRMDALSFTSLLAHISGVRIGAAAGFVAAAVTIVWAVRRARRNAAGFAGAAALVMLVFFALNKQASCNYYFLVIALCIGAMALIEAEDPAAERATSQATILRASIEYPLPFPNDAAGSAASGSPRL